MNKHICFFSLNLLAFCTGYGSEEKILPSIKVSDYTVYLSWNSESDSKYKVFYKEKLSQSWQELASVRSLGLNTELIDKVSGNERYYKVLLVPKVKWGASTSWKEEDMVAFEEQIGIPTDHIAVFIHWGNENAFPAYLKSFVKNHGKTLIIFSEATDYNNPSTEQPLFSYDAVLAGTWDSYFKSFFRSAKEYNGPVIFIPYSEMNGNWSPWSGTKNGNTPAKHIAAYRYIREFGRSATNVSFGFSANVNSVPDVSGNQIKDYYPGPEYVDIVGLDGFNFGNPWQSFGQIFNRGLTTLEKYDKPIYIFSFACAAGPAKAAWISNALTVEIPKHSKIKGWVWFNENKEHDWRVWSDTNALNAFREGVLQR